MRLVATVAVAVGFCALVVLCGAPVRAADDDSVPALVARMDGVWAHRDADGAMPDTVSLGTQALAVDPNSYEVQWRMARAYFWVAYTQSNRVVKKALAAKAMEAAERARTLQPDRIEGEYYYAITVGEYANTIGVMQALSEGVLGKIKSSAERAYAIDRDYERGAPGTVLGRLYFMLPWPKRDLDRSRRYLEEVVARHPRALVARCYLADTYYALDEHEKAREQLTFVLANEGEPGSEFDRPAPKTFAREAMQRWFPGAGGAPGQ
jgi:tetratricopeptide (TPR) repeat protein